MPVRTDHAAEPAPATFTGAHARPVLIFDGETFQLRFANADAVRAIGRPLDELRGLTIVDLTPRVSLEAWRRLTRRMASAGRGATRFRTVFGRVDGDTFPGEVAIEKISDGDATLYHATIDPVADRDAETRGRLESALLESVINTAPDAIITIDRGGRIASFSPAAERMFGYRAAEVIGQNVSVLMPDPYRSEHDGYIARYLATGEKRIIGIGRTVIARHKSGSTFPMELAVGEVRSEGQHVFTGFIRDISERVAAQARVNRLQQELNHVGRVSAMGEIASMIVHELNQPLTAIANFGEAAKRLLVQGEDQRRRARDLIEKSVAQAHRASEMIRRLRGFVSKDLSDAEMIVVNDVIRDAARLALIGAADCGIRTQYALAGDLPEILADRLQVQQIVVNLIRNAIDAMLEGKATSRRNLHLTIASCRDGDDAIQIAVSDTGPGIAPEVAANLFNPFTTTKAGGMGIGLSICRSIVEAHGGRIWFEGNPDGGSRFAFSLPVQGRAEAGR